MVLEFSTTNSKIRRIFSSYKLHSPFQDNSIPCSNYSWPYIYIRSSTTATHPNSWLWLSLPPRICDKFTTISWPELPKNYHSVNERISCDKSELPHPLISRVCPCLEELWWVYLDHSRYPWLHIHIWLLCPDPACAPKSGGVRPWPQIPPMIWRKKKWQLGMLLYFYFSTESTFV